MQIYSGQVDGIILWFLWRLTDSHFQNVKQEKVNSMEKKKEESARAAKYLCYQLRQKWLLYTSHLNIMLPLYRS